MVPENKRKGNLLVRGLIILLGMAFACIWLPCLLLSYFAWRLMCAGRCVLTKLGVRVR